EMVLALMLIVAKNPTRRAIARGQAVPLYKILNDMPTQLREGLISWLILEGEAEPSSLIIHTDIESHYLAMFARSRLIMLALEKVRKERLSFLNPFNSKRKLNETRNAIGQVREQAKQSRLANSEPVAWYLE
ncbi:MAG: hypothetical protein M3Z24_13340, partial [Chloroflexota bacterium]|nr:hypothetical protein [Chloroflexota bacterium]